MMYATKGNQQVKIDEDEKDTYAAQGYTVLDGNGNAVECAFHAPVPYDEHIKAVKAAKSGKTKELEARVAELEAELKEIMNAVPAADEFQ